MAFYVSVAGWVFGIQKNTSTAIFLQCIMHFRTWGEGCPSMWKTLSTPSFNFTCCNQLLFSRLPVFLVTCTPAQKNVERLFHAQLLQLCLLWHLLSLPGFGIEFDSPCVKVEVLCIISVCCVSDWKKKKACFLNVHEYFNHVSILFFTFSLPWDLHVIFSSLLHLHEVWSSLVVIVAGSLVT